MNWVDDGRGVAVWRRLRALGAGRGRSVLTSKDKARYERAKAVQLRQDNIDVVCRDIYYITLHGSGNTAVPLDCRVR